MENVRLVTVLVFVVCALSLSTLAQTPPPQKTNNPGSALPATSLNGKITRKGAGLTVSAVGVRPVSVNVSIKAKTTFSLNGVAADFASIRVGDSVVVKYLPLAGEAVNAISVEVHRHRIGRVEDVLEPLPPPAYYPYCPHVGPGGTVTGTPCYCNACGGAGSGMVW